MNTPTTDKFKFRTNGDPEWVVDAEVARGLELEVRRLRAECEKLRHERNRAGKEARKKIMDGIKTERNQATVARIQRNNAQEELKRLRALVDELSVPEPSRGMPLRGGDFDLMELAGATVTVASKQIKPGPILDIPLNGAMQCTKCGKPDRASLWFRHGYLPACPHCGAVFVCNAGAER